MSGLCEGRVCVVTGAGRGIGRAHALLLASEGARVVVNDYGGALDGTPEIGGGELATPAQTVVDDIVAKGGEAVAHVGDVSSWAVAEDLVATAVAHFGQVDVLVNNAGILRDRTIVNMTEQEWDDVIRVHMKGTFAPTHFAANHWRQRVKDGEQVQARVINTTSASGLYGNAGQANYGAAKAGIAAFTIIAAAELARYGVTVNALAPVALTRMSEDLGLFTTPEEQDAMAPRWIAPICVWLASVHSDGVTARVFEASGRHLAVAEGWRRGPYDRPSAEPSGIDAIIRPLLDRAKPNADITGR